jgi:hypothetical protein
MKQLVSNKINQDFFLKLPVNLLIKRANKFRVRSIYNKLLLITYSYNKKPKTNHKLRHK